MRIDSLVGCLSALWMLMFPVAVTYLIVVSRIFIRLERDFPSDYEALGRPSLFMNNTLASGLRFTRFLLMREFADLPDVKLRSLATVARWALIAGLIVTTLSLLLVPVVLVSRHAG